ncbi:YhbY family RNA-binding protein [Candidatus Woesearchaeota archaeon]|nr:YhbY family RNA-binding protein [Candidatus Woesearchaeota archaeon]
MVEPVIVIGKNGMTPQVLDEIRKQLKLHETVKVRFPPMLATGRAKRLLLQIWPGKLAQNWRRLSVLLQCLCVRII